MSSTGRSRASACLFLFFGPKFIFLFFAFSCFHQSATKDSFAFNSTMRFQFAFVVCIALCGVANAHPNHKTCTSSAGCDGHGLPDPSGTFTAMGANWTKVVTAPSDVLRADGGKLVVDVPTSNGGMFVIVNSGTLDIPSSSGYSSDCEHECSRLVCVEGLSDGGVPVTITNTDNSTCGHVQLVVGYAEGQLQGNTLQFAFVNTCNPSNVTIGAVHDLDDWVIEEHLGDHDDDEHDDDHDHMDEGSLSAVATTTVLFALLWCMT